LIWSGAVAIESLPTTALGIFEFLVGLLILWVVISIPVYFSGKAIKGRQSSFGQAMAATLGGGLAYSIAYFLVAVALGAVIGPPARVFALLLGLLLWLAVYRGVFNTTWLGAVGIVVLAWIILIILDVILVALFGVRFPNFFPF
jgi:hypothetical protein